MIRARSLLNGALVVAALSAPAATLAAPPPPGQVGPPPPGQIGPPPPGQIGGGGTRAVPEFDPAVAGSIAMLIGAGTVLLARRRR